MSFNLLGAVVHGAESFLMSGGNPVAAGIGAFEGGMQQKRQSQMPQMPGLSDALSAQPDILAEVNQLSKLAGGAQISL